MKWLRMLTRWLKRFGRPVPATEPQKRAGKPLEAPGAVKGWSKGRGRSFR